ncbi:MAG: ArsR family transcriptional regulator [Acidobacteria bacterium]|nr:ArsR family transcriptional regulator [Acidobacteriota bacterium]
MKATKLGERFFESTRGRIVILLRGGTRTVNELREELGLTDNAVRAHLLSLERDGLIRQSGIQPGHRKPHFAYELTAEAEHLFPKAYDAVLNQLISVLKDRLSPQALDQILREVGRSIADGAAVPANGRTLGDRLQKALQVLESLGGTAKVEKDGDGFVIRSGSCPLGASVSSHPEVCKLAEALVATIVGATVREHCDREESPRCRFEIAGNGAAATNDHVDLLGSLVV